MTTPNAGSSDAEFFQQRGFGQKLGFGQRPSLLIVDMAKAFTDPEMPLGAKLDSQIESHPTAVACGSRSRHARHFFDCVLRRRKPKGRRRVWNEAERVIHSARRAPKACRLTRGSTSGRPIPCSSKKYASCFFGTDLVSRLLVRGVDTLIITGCTTSGCVRASAVDACQTGFRPMVVREAVGDRSQSAHEQSLFDLNAKYADVVSLEETLQYLRTLRAATALGPCAAPEPGEDSPMGESPLEILKNTTAFLIPRLWTGNPSAGRRAHASQSG